MSRMDREELVYPHLETLPEQTQQDITILLLFAPDELPRSMMNLEFEDPVPSDL